MTAFEVALAAGAGRPAVIHDTGAPERIALHDRANMHSGLPAGSIVAEWR